MLWLMILTVSLICLIPCIFVLYRKHSLTTMHASALQIYQSQLKELNQELEHGLILPEAYNQAKLEIQRRILSNDQQNNIEFYLSASPNNGLFFILCGLGCIPLAAIGLYLINGNPALPPQPLQSRLLEQKERNQQLAPYVQQLKAKIATLDHHDPKRIEGYLLLGRIEADQNHLTEAIQAWQEALTQHYDPTLAAQIAEMLIQKNGHVTQEAYELFQQALKVAPADIPWRNLAEQRIIEYKKSNP